MGGGDGRWRGKVERGEVIGEGRGRREGGGKGSCGGSQVQWKGRRGRWGGVGGGAAVVCIDQYSMDRYVLG